MLCQIDKWIKTRYKEVIWQDFSRISQIRIKKILVLQSLLELEGKYMDHTRAEVDRRNQKRKKEINQ